MWKAVDVQLRLLEEKEAVFQREKELCVEKRKKLLQEIKKKRCRQRKNGKRSSSFTTSTDRGKAEYLARKKWEGNLAEEMETELAGLVAKEEGIRQRIEEIDVDSVSIVEWLGCREDKRKLLQCLIESVDVNARKEIEICWSFKEKMKIR